ncbi:MAG: 2,4-dihydroxyhept-2-ene-1,7-dioic acid aldolase [Bacteroidetes bacterium]|nr:2,4-dihydroxyhept-2-ene-1,7-dioic acid aldolase [Bacteroidota bacterium]
MAKYSAKDLRGSIVPLVTPFRDGKVDEKSLGSLIEWQVASGSHGVSVTGTTGEPTALSRAEREKVIRLASEIINKRLPFVAATGSNNHEETLHFSQLAQQAGADAVLLITPFYVRPSQEGLFRHFKSVADSLDLPVILYNIPGRSAINLEIDTVARLRENCRNIIGIKEANHDFSHITRLIGKLGRDFLVYSGIELLCFPILAIGGAGYVSATGNIMPKEVARLYDLFAAGKWQEAQDLHYYLMPLNDAVFIEINPVPAKTALGMMGRISPEVRLPLAPLSKENEQKLRSILNQYHLLKDR